MIITQYRNGNLIAKGNAKEIIKISCDELRQSSPNNFFAETPLNKRLIWVQGYITASED